MPVLQQLHWLPVRQRVKFKIAMLVYKALHNLLPANLAEDFQLVSVTGHRRLRSSDTDTCLVQRTNTHFRDRSFAVAGPRVWNSLPTQLWESDITLGQFRRALKTHLFGHWQLQREWQCFSCTVYKLAYLLTYLLAADLRSSLSHYKQSWWQIDSTADIVPAIPYCHLHYKMQLVVNVRMV